MPTATCLATPQSIDATTITHAATAYSYLTSTPIPTPAPTLALMTTATTATTANTITALLNDDETDAYVDGQ